MLVAGVLAAVAGVGVVVPAGLAPQVNPPSPPLAGVVGLAAAAPACPRAPKPPKVSLDVSVCCVPAAPAAPVVVGVVADGFAGVADGAVPNSPPLGFGPKSPPVFVVAGGAPNSEVEPVDPPEVPEAVEVVGPPKRLGVEVPAAAGAGELPKRPPLGLGAAPNKPILGAELTAGCVVVVELAGCPANPPPKREPVGGAVVGVAGFGPNSPPPPRALPAPSDGEAVAPNRPPEGVAGLSALGVVAAAGLAPKENPPVAGAGDPVG